MSAVEDTAGRVFRFGEFSLDVEKRGHFRRQERIELAAKPFEVPVLLVQRRGGTVTKAELRELVWRVPRVEDN